MGRPLILGSCALLAACSSLAPEGEPGLSHAGRAALRLGDARPTRSEVAASGPLTGPIRRGDARFAALVRSDLPDLVYKDEERTGADRMMTPRLSNRLAALSRRVAREWPGVKLRVTDAWDEDREHGRGSLHYEGRAADLTTSDGDSRKLGRLAMLATEAELDWVYFESMSHVHVSVR